MTWHYQPDEANDRIRLRFVDDSGTIHGPMDVPWPDAPTLTTALDDWIIDPNVKEAAGEGCTDLYTSVGAGVALMALRDLAAGNVEEGNP